jgi:hypothetical protein
MLRQLDSRTAGEVVPRQGAKNFTTEGTESTELGDLGVLCGEILYALAAAGLQRGDALHWATS